MSVDLSDPSIPAAYSEVIGNAATNWLLLGYGDTNNKLTLYDTGSHGLEELRGYLGEEVLFGLLNVEGRLLLLAYMPDTVSGVKRARALVHSRAVGNTFKAHHAVLTASRPSQVEEEDVRDKLGLGLGSPARASNNAYPKPRASDDMPPTPPPSVPCLSSASADSRHMIQEPKGSPSPAQPPSAYEKRGDQRLSSESRTSSLQQALASATQSPQPIANNAPSSEQHIAAGTPPVTAPALPEPSQVPAAASDEDAPPPPPPKPDFPRRGSSTTVAVSQYPTNNGTPYQQQSTPLPAPSMLPYPVQPLTNDPVGVPPSPPMVQPRQSGHTIRSGPPQTEAQLQAAISRAKWQAEEQDGGSPQRGQAPVRIDPAAFAEAERLRREKELQDRTQLDAEEQRRLHVEEYRRQEAVQRLKQEEARRAAEAQRKAAEEKWQAAMEKQRQDALLARQRQLDEEIRRRNQAEEEKRQQRERWIAERASMAEKFKQLQVAGEVMLTGWASHQVGIIWRRRHFELRPDCLMLFKNAEENMKPMGEVTVYDIVDIVDARDELQLPHSLRVDFKQKESEYFYCDSEEDKEVFMTALRQAARL